MTVDRTKFRTRLALHPALFENPNTYIHERGLNVWTSKPTQGKSRRGPTQDLYLDVLTYKGIKIHLKKFSDDPMTDVTIDFNPGKCLYGHNGRALDIGEFLDALGLLVTSLKPFLNDPNDWTDLVPGLRTPGVAYWDYLEIYLQCDDREGNILAGFRHAQRNNPNTAVRHWPTSMEIGGKKSALQFAIYCKALEMVETGKLQSKELPDYENILRLEGRLRDQKLVHYLGNERNVEEIDGVSRLVKFYPLELVNGHRKCFGELRGVFQTDGPLGTLRQKDQLTPLGRLLARVVLDQRVSMTFPEILNNVRFYTGADTDTMKEIRNAGQEVITSQSTLSQLDLFSDLAYQRQPSVVSNALEAKVTHEMEDIFHHPLIYAAYKPRDGRFTPIVQIPSYYR